MSVAIDWSPVVQPVLLAGSTVLSAILGNVALWFRRKLMLGRDTELNQRVGAAAEAGAGLAYSRMQQGKSKALAIEDGVEYVQEGMPAIITELGLKPDRIAEMVEARLGKLMAIDPTVSVAK